MSGSNIVATWIFAQRGFVIKCHHCQPPQLLCHLCWSQDSGYLMNRPAVSSGPMSCQQHHTEWAEHSDLDSQAQRGKRMKIDRNVMKCLGILSAILTDIGLQFRWDIIPKLPTATVERLSRTQSHPMNHVKRRNQMLWGDIATCDEMQPIPCFALIFM